MIKTVGVIGAGTMGNGIAQVFAQAGFDVRLHDAAAGAIDRARATIEKSLGEVRREGRSSPPRTATRRSAGCTPRRRIDALADVDYVVEAVVENARREARDLRDARRHRRDPT